jgi:hypothetical protein
VKLSKGSDEAGCLREGLAMVVGVGVARAGGTALTGAKNLVGTVRGSAE